LASFSIEINGQIFSTEKKDWLFENGMDDLKKKLPEAYKFKNCYGCMFSDYSVYGQHFYGDMYCYKNIKEDYIRAANKHEYMSLKADRNVQETFLCDEFEIRKYGLGYRS